MMVRLVKGAYWDTEIKRAQERGLDDYPVFTRKAMTDLNYVACARQLLALRPRHLPAIRHPQRADGRDRARTGRRRRADFEFQRLHGMGEALYAQLERGPPRASPAAPMRRSAATAICWPIWCGGCWRTAPTRPSWRSPPTRPCRWRRCCGVRPTSSARAANARHPNIPLPRDLYRPQRIEFARHRIRRARGAEPAARGDRRRDQPATRKRRRCDAGTSRTRAIVSRARGIQGRGAERRPQTRARHPGTGRRPAGATRARISSRCCNAKAARRWTTRFRKCARPSISAAIMPRRAANCSATARPCRGRPARATCCGLRGRGVFVAISPWNFPLAIFLGQVTAALMAGNAVVAKPAEQTPLIAARGRAPAA